MARRIVIVARPLVIRGWMTRSPAIPGLFTTFNQGMSLCMGFCEFAWGGRCAHGVFRQGTPIIRTFLVGPRGDTRLQATSHHPDGPAPFFFASSVFPPSVQISASRGTLVLVALENICCASKTACSDHIVQSEVFCPAILTSTDALAARCQ